MWGRSIEDKYLGIIYVQKAKMKPVMFIRNNSEIKASEGEILYRYSSENKKIRASELQAILEERMRNMSELVLQKHLATILNNGPENSAVLNIKTGEIEGKSGKFMIDENLLPKIQFIKEGDFSETKGAPALKLIGSLESYDKRNILSKEVNITDNRILDAFLNPENISEPLALVNYQLDHDTFLPIFRFIQLANTTPQEVAERFKQSATTKVKRRDKQVQRILDSKPPKASISREKNQELFTELLNKSIDHNKLDKDIARKLLLLINQLEKSEIDLEYLTDLVKTISNNFPNDVKIRPALRSSLRYIDHLLYRE